MKERTETGLVRLPWIVLALRRLNRAVELEGGVLVDRRSRARIGRVVQVDPVRLPLRLIEGELVAPSYTEITSWRRRLRREGRWTQWNPRGRWVGLPLSALLRPGPLPRGNSPAGGPERGRAV